MVMVEVEVDDEDEVRKQRIYQCICIAFSSPSHRLRIAFMCIVVLCSSVGYVKMVMVWVV